MTTVTDRERVRSMSDVRSKREDVYVRTDTVYIEKEADKTLRWLVQTRRLTSKGM